MIAVALMYAICGALTLGTGALFFWAWWILHVERLIAMALCCLFAAGIFFTLGWLSYPQAIPPEWVIRYMLRGSTVGLTLSLALLADMVLARYNSHMDQVHRVMYWWRHLRGKRAKWSPPDAAAALPEASRLREDESNG